MTSIKSSASKSRAESRKWPRPSTYSCTVGAPASATANADLLAISNFGETLAAVDLAGYGAGGLVARAYVQSDAYAVAGAVQVDDLILSGVPNEGVAWAYSLLHDDFSATHGLAGPRVRGQGGRHWTGGDAVHGRAR